MLFNSYVFIFAFLPACLAAFYAAGWFGAKAQVLVLIAASMIFYCGWDIRYLPLLLISTCFNFAVGKAIIRFQNNKGLWLTAGIVGNLLVLGTYKYANFFIETANEFGASFPALQVILPLGISFFTFTQLAFLVDAYKGKTDDPRFFEYVAFVTYFPHLIAGPIIYHHETIPQFRRRKLPSAIWFAPGLALFSIGLAKKVVLADSFGAIAKPVFDGFAIGANRLTGFDAWVGALSYTFQLYFDFSAYSDMAVGISLMLGIYIPLNFNSPYKATSIIEFWRRWHMTLSRYLRDYLYIPMGGSRHGSVRRYVNLLLTMLIGGFWHGAGWTFIAWGGLHGLYLVVNHAWRYFVGERQGHLFGRLAGGLLTFLCVVFAWVLFRSDNITSALSMLDFMTSWVYAPPASLDFLGWLSEHPQLSQRVDIPIIQTFLPTAFREAGIRIWADHIAIAVIAAALAIVWLAPNSTEIVFRGKTPWDNPLEIAPAPSGWMPAWWLSPWTTVAFMLSLALLIAAPPGEFLYFNF